MDRVRAEEPDVIVLECESAGGFGCGTADAIEQIRARLPGQPDHRPGLPLRRRAVLGRAQGRRQRVHLTRRPSEGDVVDAVRSVAAGHTWVSPAIVTRMVDTYVRRNPDGGLDDPYEALSERERQILLMAAMGHTNRDIARSLSLSEQTVHNNRAAVMEKLGLHDRVELLRYAVRRGLLNPATL